ncbi:MAG: carboxypeptidase regulatory-like domain-containing protein [Armatimonadota bacterium]
MNKGFYIVLLCASALIPSLTGVAAPKQERMLFGVSLGNYYPHPANIASDLKYFQLMKDAGVEYFGYGFNWDVIEKQRGKYNLAQWDYVVELANKFGFKIEGVIVGCPEWALPKSGDLGWLPVALNMPREDCIPDFEKFCSMLATRYKGKVAQWTFWNEPNGYNMAPTVGENDPRYQGKIALYTKYLKICYRAMKEADPKVIVACGGMDTGGKSGVWLEGLYANGAKGYMDAVPIHPYTNAPPYVDEEYIQKTRAIMDKHGDKDKPIWINEFGTYNPDKKMIETAYTTVRDKYPYVTCMMLHTFQDFMGGDGLQPWGLIDLQLNIKPTGGYEAFKAFPKPPKEPAHQPTGNCSITGKVMDVQTGKPIARNYVLAMPGVYYAQTDGLGVYTITGMPAGTYSVTTGAPGLNKVDPMEVKLSGPSPVRVDFNLTRTVYPLGEGETFDPAKDSADGMRDNLVVNGSFDQMRSMSAGQIGVGWWPFNTVQHMTYMAGAGVGGTGLSQMMGHSGQAVQQGIYQIVPTVPGQKYRLTFWFMYTGQGAVADKNNCNRFGIDPGYGEWATKDCTTGRMKYGFPETLRWYPNGAARITSEQEAATLDIWELCAECDKRAGGSGKGAGKWYKFSVEFVAKDTKTGIWFNAAATEFENSRKYFDEISVVPVSE